jgi:hypothetical protein
MKTPTVLMRVELSDKRESRSHLFLSAVSAALTIPVVEAQELSPLLSDVVLLS